MSTDQATLKIVLESSANVSQGHPRAPYQPQPTAPPIAQTGGLTPAEYQNLVKNFGAQQAALIAAAQGGAPAVAGAPVTPAQPVPPAPPPMSFWQKYFQPSSPESRQSAGFASIGLGMAGMGGAVAVTGGYAALGPAGAALAAIDQFGKQMQQMVEGVMKPMASMDAHGVEHGLGAMVEKIPILGGLFGTLVNGTLALSDAVQATAVRLSAYNGELAVQQAMIQIRQIERDMQRAQQFGPQIQQAVEARFQFDQKLEDILDRNLPAILELTKNGVNVLSDMLPAILNAINRFMTPVDSLSLGFANFMEFLGLKFPGIINADYWRDIQQQLQQMAQAAANDNDQDPDIFDRIFRDFSQMAGQWPRQSSPGNTTPYQGP